MKHIHFIGICGVAMSALAIAFKKAGWKVTGSDKGFYPPVSTHLKEAGVDYYAGWHADNMGTPDLVVIGNVAGSENPEWVAVQEKKIPYKSYPEVVKEFLIKKNSIVCAGTFGKSTTSALMSWILKNSGSTHTHHPLLDKEGQTPQRWGGFVGGSDNDGGETTPSPLGGVHPSLPRRGWLNGERLKEDKLNDEDMNDPNYMFGAISLNGLEAANISGTSDYSVVEGDEYKTSRWDNKAKFFHYSPTHLLLTAVVWDHADVYPTEAEYIAAFQDLVAMVPADGTLVISEKALPRIKSKELRVKNYGIGEKNDYQYSDIRQSAEGISFNIKHNSKLYTLNSKLLGDYMADNMTGCFAMAMEIGIPAEKIISAIQSFKSVKRRLEKRLDGSITVFDDIAHSPTKAQAVLNALRKVYKKRIIAVFEPNTGNREQEAIPGYDNAFKDADIVFIPRLTKVKVDPSDPNPPIEGDALAKVIGKTHDDVRYRDNDEDLIDELVAESAPGDVIIFLGSHGFRGMIEYLCDTLLSS